MAEQSISLCIISKNEEKNIAECINSAKGCADEIVVVDTGSTDKTVEIAKKSGAKIFGFKWADDFSKARNESLKHATKDWVLVLDADEVLDNEGVKSVKELVKSKDADGYLMMQVNYTNDASVAGFMPAFDKQVSKGCKGFYVSLITRLFKNNKDYTFTGAVHELVENSIRNRKGKILSSNIQIHHYGNVESDKARQKRKYYLELARKKAKDMPTADSCYELGVLLRENGLGKESLDAFRNAIKADEKHLMSLYELGVASEASKDYDSAIDYYTKMLRVREDAEGFFSLGTCYLKKGMLQEAKRNLTKSLLLNAYKVSTYNNLGAVHERMGNYKEAIHVLEIGMKIEPANSAGAYNLGVAYAKSGNYGKAVESFEKAVSLGHKNSDRIKKEAEKLKSMMDKLPGYKFTFNAG